MKRLIALLLALLLTGSVLPLATAESEKEVFYTGGVVSRTMPRSVDVELLQVAYATNDAPYLLLNEATLWEVTISGGKAPYTCDVLVCYQDFSKDPKQDGYWGVHSCTLDASGRFQYTCTKPGRYFMQFTVTDAAGQKLVFQTKVTETYTAKDETDPTTVAGKINSIIKERITDDMSDYTRALVLHDWLIYNANYDYTYTRFDAAGVLLHGTGVCDSYTCAYQMLCTAAGLKCLRVVTDDFTHAWNLVKVGGEWFHVDCTWDDPGTGGHENHRYFLLTDEEMARDHHEWRRTDNDIGMLVPETGEKQEEDPDFHYDLTFTTISELDTRIDAVIADMHKGTYYMLYLGDDLTGITSQFQTWWESKAQALYRKYSDIQGLAHYTSADSNQVFRIIIHWGSSHDYVTLAESRIAVSIGTPYQIKPAEYAPQANVFTWTSSDPTIVTVSGSYTAADGLIMTVTGHKAGTATVTITSKDGFCDSVVVEVMPPLQPDFGLKLTAGSKDITLTWNRVPGATEYQIYRSVEGQVQLLATVKDTSITLEAAQVPANVRQHLYVKALRKVAGSEVLTYTSESLTYGRPSISYNATLPSGVKIISEMSFMDDTSLTTFAVPAGVQTIEANAFAGCTGLTALRIPDSVNSIAGSAFSGCPLKYVEVSEGSYADQWFAANFPNVERIVNK